MADPIDTRAFDFMTEATDSVSLFDEDLIVPRQESGRSERIGALGSEGYFDFDISPQKGDFGDMHLWVDPGEDESYWRYLEKSLAGGRWELSGQSEEYDAYRIKPELIKSKDHWGDSEVGKRISQAVREGIEWGDLPEYLEGYNTWRSISPDRDLKKELE
jgi:hypothetical protein